MSTHQHSRLITEAARFALRPIGCVQKGRSRIWLDDQSWWIGIVEFQPSAWSKGSYLNVGACWLWYEKDYFSFDAGHRVEEFQPFTGEEQFLASAKMLADRAKQEVIALRGRFPSPSHVYTWLMNRQPASIWDHYHRAMSAGLAGATAQSKRSFTDVISDPEDQPWADGIRRRSAELLRCLERGNGFNAEVKGIVQRARGLLGVPAPREETDQLFE